MIRLKSVAIIFLALSPCNLIAAEIDFDSNCPELSGWQKSDALKPMQIEGGLRDQIKTFPQAIKICRYTNENLSEIRFMFMDMKEIILLGYEPSARSQIRNLWDNGGSEKATNHLKSTWTYDSFDKAIQKMGGSHIKSESIACPPSPGFSFCTKNPILNPKTSGITRAVYDEGFSVSVFSWSRDFIQTYNIEVASSPTESKSHSEMIRENISKIVGNK